MKLSLKIFLGICIPSLAAIIIVSTVLINKSFNTNLDLQIELYTEEFDNIINGIDNSFSSSYDYEKILNAVGSYYKENEKYLSLYKDNSLIYSNNENIVPNSKELLNIQDGSYNAVIEKKNKDYYLYIASLQQQGNTLVYMRSLNNVYSQRKGLTNLCILIVTTLIVIITFVAYIISKTLTKPLQNIKKEMNKLSSGNFDISLKEGKDEIGDLIHEFNIMSKELKKRNKDLIDMIDSKQLFIDNLSHEMNTPLTSIYGYSKLIENAELSDEQKIKYLQYIQTETNRISEMYKKLLTISYKENSDIDKNNIKISTILNELQIELASRFEEKNLKLIIENEIDDFYCDKMLISLAISNLLRNAIEISEENKNIKIKSYVKNNKKCICIIDEGKGIEKNQIDKIIEPFYRIDKSRSRKHGGAGLGLSIVNRIMELHQGNLKIESEICSGSTFILEFPNETKKY